MPGLKRDADLSSFSQTQNGAINLFIVRVNFFCCGQRTVNRVSNFVHSATTTQARQRQRRGVKDSFCMSQGHFLTLICWMLYKGNIVPCAGFSRACARIQQRLE